MVRQGYDKGFVASLLAASGTLGLVIPPSVCMVVYSQNASCSIGDMFLAGFIPGILAELLLAVLSVVIAKRRKYQQVDVGVTNAREAISITLDAFLPLLMPVIILGGIYGGIFTPTEASVVAVVYGILVSFLIYREMTVRQFISALVDSAVAGSVILLMISTSMAFSWIFARQGLSTLVVSSVSSVFTTATSFMILSFVIFLIFGTFMDANANALLLLPLMFPVAQSLGIDAIHYCIFATGALIIGSSSPPVAVNIFTAVSVTGLPMSRVIRGMMPFFIVMIVTVFLYSFFPQLSTFLPNLIGT